MLLKAYCIYDNKALVYHSPFFAPTDGSAIRSLTDLVGDPQTAVGRHPSDYVLYCVGSYDDQRGMMLPVSPLVHVVDAIALVRLNQADAPLFNQPGYDKVQAEWFKDQAKANGEGR